VSRINPRLAKRHRCFTVFELAGLLDVHRNTVRLWIREGLPVLDGAKPILIDGGDFQAWWGKRTKARKRPCLPGQMYCFKCREPKAPALGMVEYAATNAATGNLKALCETCGTMMHRRTRLGDIAARMPGLPVQITQAPSSIDARAHPSPNCDNPKGA
jgi:hypothetical protein